MDSNRIGRLMVGVSIGVALCIGGWIQPSFSQAQETGAQGSTQDKYQRSTAIYYFKKFAESGPKRGEEIYFFRCWVCHNEYTIEANAPNAAPTLKDLYQRPKMLTTGQPVNDTSVADKIRNGGPGMPGYRYAINDRDMADLLSYFREGLCCWDEENNPRNPAYRGGP